MAAPSFQIFKMCQAFKNLGHEITLLCLVGKSDLSISEEEIFEHYGVKPFNLCRVPLRGIYRLLKGIGLEGFFIGCLSASYALLKQVELVYTRQSIVAYYALRAGTGVIYETHPFPYGEQRYWDGKEYEPKLLQLVHNPHFVTLVTLSPLVAEAYVKLGVPENKILVQSSGIDFERYAELISKVEARRVLQIPLDQKLVLYVGKFSKLKGTRLVFQIAGHMPSVQFILLGYWGEKDIEEEFRRNYADQNVEIRGVVSSKDLPTWLASADVLLLPTLKSEPSSQWTSPLKLFEYMASGRPIVASNLPNISNIVDSNESALLVDKDSIHDYIKSLNFLLNNPARAKKIGATARGLCQQFTWERRVTNILSYTKPEGS
jgi:glycosyltransferase involved in cell wall biosynthesis